MDEIRAWHEERKEENVEENVEQSSGGEADILRNPFNYGLGAFPY